MANKAYRVAVLTASDKGFAGEREDKSGPLIVEMMETAGYSVVDTELLPDEREQLAAQLFQWCSDRTADLILTTGGTGLSPRDWMPEATMDIADRPVPGIADAIRAHSLSITDRAMLSRATSVVCKRTLIINLPGSPKAVRESLEYVLPTLGHALEILTGEGGECAR